MKQSVLKFQKEDLISLTEAAYDKIRRAIILKELAPGSRISERVLSANMGVSTTTVKRALDKLSVEGLVEIHPRKGTYVVEFLSASMKENTIIRAYLEGLAARFAAEKAEADDIEKLRRQIDIMRESTEKGTLKKLVESNTRFHSLIHDAGKNPYVRRLIDVIRTFDLNFRGRALSDHAEAERGFQEHNGVFEAICAGDALLAEERMKKHILRTLDFVLQTRSYPDQ